MSQFEGVLLGKGLKFGVVISRFNEFIIRKLLEGAQDALLRQGVNPDDIDIVYYRVFQRERGNASSSAGLFALIGV